MGAASIIPDSFAKVLKYEADKEAALRNMGELRRSASAADANAVSALQLGGQQAGLLEARGSMLAGQQRVGYAIGNVDASSGTAADVQASSRIFSSLDAQTARNNAVRQAFGHREVARKYRLEADVLDSRYATGDVGHGALGGGTANDELTLSLGLSALGAAANSGMGGG